MPEDKDIFDRAHKATQKHFGEHGTVEKPVEKPAKYKDGEAGDGMADDAFRKHRDRTNDAFDIE